jgi:cytoskeletal protein RodZ
MQQSIGEKLKKARLEKNVSLEEAYKQTRIHPHVLKGLEQDQAHNFLSRIYIKGFLKTYAQYLGLDGEKLIKEYSDSQRDEWPGSKAAKAAAVPEVPLEKPRFSPPRRFFKPVKIIAVVLLICGLVFYFRFLAKSTSRPDKPDKEVVKVPEAPVEVVPLPDLKAAEAIILEVTTRDSCWMRVKVDNQSIFENTLAKGKTEKWEGKEKIELRIGKPEALEVFLNGTLLNLKKLKVKKSLVVTHKGIKAK